MNDETRQMLAETAACTCFHDCRMCSRSGDWHQHADEPCIIHPDAEVS